MNSTTLWIIIAVLVVLAFYFYNRSRPAPRGTYNDPNFRSSGSIGGGTRANDDPNFRSSGSIGGAQTERRATETVNRPSNSQQNNGPARPAHDDENFKSGGSFGA